MIDALLSASLALVVVILMIVIGYLILWLVIMWNTMKQTSAFLKDAEHP